MSVIVAPGPPTWWGVLTGWQPDVFLVPALGAVGLYLAGTQRLARRGRSWPKRRTACFLGGVATILVATESGLARYDTILFSLHVVQHILLGMIAPLLLALGAPVTLLLQAGSRRVQVRTLRVLHSRPVRFVAHPVTTWLLFGTTLFVLYFTSLYAVSLRDPPVHALVHAHMVIVGSLFMGHVVGLDPVPHALGYGARIGYIFLALPFHTFLGIALLSGDRVLAAGWYAQVVRHWGGSPLADQRTGAGLLWIFGELFGVVAMLVVAAQWWAHEERVARRHDEMLDRLGAPG